MPTLAPAAEQSVPHAEQIPRAIAQCLKHFDALSEFNLQDDTADASLAEDDVEVASTPDGSTVPPISNSAAMISFATQAALFKSWVLQNIVYDTKAGVDEAPVSVHALVNTASASETVMFKALTELSTALSEGTKLMEKIHTHSKTTLICANAQDSTDLAHAHAVSADRPPLSCFELLFALSTAKLRRTSIAELHLCRTRATAAINDVYCALEPYVSQSNASEDGLPLSIRAEIKPAENIAEISND